MPLVAFHLVISICTVLRTLAGLQPMGVLPVATLVLLGGHLVLLRLTSRKRQQLLYKWRLVGVTVVRLAHLIGVVGLQLAVEAANSLMHKAAADGSTSSGGGDGNHWQLMTRPWWSPQQLASTTPAAAAAEQWQACPATYATSSSSRPLHTSAAVIAAVLNPRLLAATAATPVVGSAVLSLLLPLPLRLHVPLQGLVCVLVAWQPGAYLRGLLAAHGAHTTGASTTADYRQEIGAAAGQHGAVVAGAVDAAGSTGSPLTLGPGTWEVLQRASSSLLPLLPAKDGAALPDSQQCSFGNSGSSSSSSSFVSGGAWCQLAAVQAVGWALVCTTCVRYMAEYSSRATFLRSLYQGTIRNFPDKQQQDPQVDSSDAGTAQVATCGAGSGADGSSTDGSNTAPGRLHCAGAPGASSSSSSPPPLKGTQPRDDDDAACRGAGGEQQQPIVANINQGGDSRVTPHTEGSPGCSDKAGEQVQGCSTPDGPALQLAPLNRQQTSLLLVPLKCTAVGMCALGLCLLPLLQQVFRELCQLGDQPLAVSLSVWLHMGISAAAQVLLAAGVGAAASLLTRVVLLTPLLLRGRLW